MYSESFSRLHLLICCCISVTLVITKYLSVTNNSNLFLYDLHRLIKEGICDRSSAPSVSAISRLLRGREGDDMDKKPSLDGK